MLDIFLTLDDGSDTGKPNPGVRKAKIILATTYMIAGREDYAKKIVEDFNDESHKILWSLMIELRNTSNREFWEVTERGKTNTWRCNSNFV